MSLSEDKWVMRELVRDLLGKAELPVRVLKDFHASSVLVVRIDWWRVVSRVAMWSGVKACGDGFWGAGDGGGGVLFRAKMEGWRKE
jgi:hypothetical protein